MIPLTAYYSDEITWCISTAALKPKWRNLIHMFSDWVWCFIIVQFYVYTSVMFFIYIPHEEDVKRFDFHTICLYSFATFLNLPAHIIPTSGTGRIFYIIALFFGLIFICIFNVFYLDQISRNIFYTQINSFELMQYNEYKLIGSKNAMDIFQQNLVIIFLFLESLKIYRLNIF